jgi:hypothetical protein
MKMNHRDVGWGDMVRIRLTHLASDQWRAFVNTLMNSRVP